MFENIITFVAKGLEHVLVREVQLKNRFLILKLKFFAQVKSDEINTFIIHIVFCENKFFPIKATIIKEGRIPG